VPELKKAGRFVSSAPTLYRKIRIYKKQSILPGEGDDGISQGMPTLIPESKLSRLNDGILKNCGNVDTLNDLSNDIVDMRKQNELQEGMASTSLTALQVYQLDLKKSMVNLVRKMESLWSNPWVRNLKGLGDKWLVLLSIIV